MTEGEPDPDRIATQQEFGRELTAVRKRAGLTVRQVAQKAGLPASTAGDYFSGAHLPADGRPEQLLRILKACGETDPAELARWRGALQRARRAPGRRPGGTEVPYRGLARFEREDARWFFGREDVTERLAALAAEPSQLPLILIGPSGAGKSSLLRAGLMPELAGPARLIEPTDAPLAALRAVVAGVAGEQGGAGGGARATIIVDQFESVFTLCQDEDERREFITELGELASSGLVILALRADFYRQALSYPVLAAALQSRHIVLGPMTEAQLRQAITEPARLARLDVEEGLVALLLRVLAPPDAAKTHAAHEPGVLPLLSHAMLATWENSRGSTLTMSDYLAGGGIRDALTQTAETVYGSLSEPEQRLARRLLLRLVQVSDDAPPARAMVRLGELEGWASESGESETATVLDRFVAERLIAVDADTAQITHDALLTAWPRLSGWIEEGREGLQTSRRIAEGARAWQQASREDAALLRGSQLDTARDWAADEDNRSSLGRLASEFLAESVAAAQARQRAERRRTRGLQRLVTALAVLVLAVGGLAAYSFRQRHDAIVTRDDANSREIALEAGQVRGQNAPLAADLSVAAYDTSHTPQATASLLESSGSPSAARLIDSAGVVQAVGVSPDRTLLAAAAADGTLRLWHISSPGHPVPDGAPLVAAGDSPLYATAFSPDGKILAAAGAGKTVQLWDVSRPTHPVRLGLATGPAGTIYSLAFSSDGTTLAAGGADAAVHLWKVSDPSHPAPFGTLRATGSVQSVAFAPDGKTLAAGSTDGTVRLWDVAAPATPGHPDWTTLRGPASQVTGVAFSPRGDLLAAASQDHKVWLWRVSGPAKATPDGTLSGAVNWVNAVSFSPDGSVLAAGTADASVLVWNVASRALTATLPHPQPVTSLAWDGTGRLAAADADGTVSLWTLPAPVLVTGNTPIGVAYSPDGSTIAAGGQDVQLWSAARRQLIATGPLPSGVIVNGLAYSPNGSLLAIARSDGTAELLNARTLAPAGAPFRVSATGNGESVAFSPDGQVLATAGDDGTLRLWSVTDPARPRQLSSVRDSGTYVYTVVFAPDGKTVAAASTDDLTRLWDVADPARPAALGKPLTGPTSYAIGLAFSPDSRLLAVGSADKTVRIWDVGDPAHAAATGPPLTGPTGYVWALAFSPDGSTLAAGVTDGTVWLWHVADPAHPSLVATLTGPAGHVYSIAYAPSGRTLAAASTDGTVHLWDTSPAAAQAAVCGDAGQTLTTQEWATYVPETAYRAPCAPGR